MPKTDPPWDLPTNDNGNISVNACPLCAVVDAESFHEDRHRRYFRCRNCRLVFVPPRYFLSLEAEKAEYDLHQNSPADPGYRRFLNRLFEPLHARLAENSRGLDFGAGPGPTLSVMFEEVGHEVALFDAFYAPDHTVFEHTYDFITATEVVEHLHDPQTELERLRHCLAAGGHLGIMTKLVLDRSAFAGWHYKHDLTHVCFFSQPTFRWLAHKWDASLTFIGKDVILLQKR